MKKHSLKKDFIFQEGTHKAPKTNKKFATQNVLVSFDVFVSFTAVKQTEIPCNYLYKAVKHREILCDYLYNAVKHRRTSCDHLYSAVRNREIPCGYLYSAANHREVPYDYLKYYIIYYII